MQCNLIKVPVEFKNKKGEPIKSYDYYLTFENGETIAILPKWAVVGEKKTSEYDRLRALSTKVERQ